MTTLADLDARVTALEQASPESDSIAPNYLTFNADGTVTIVFPGGIKMPARDLGGAPAPNTMVEWTVPDGSDAGDIFVDFSTNWRRMFIEAFTPALPSGHAIFRLDAGAPAGGGIGRSRASVDVADETAGFSHTAYIMDSLGQSSFAQLAAGVGTALIRFGNLGAVNSDGGGWCNFTLPAAFPTALDFVLAMNTFAGTNGSAFMDVQAVDAGHFRCFVNQVGINCSCTYLAIGH